jgi:ferritin-like metal-binding protein YciE
MNSLNEVFEDMLKDVYFAEQTIVKSLPKMAKAATSPQLRSGFEKHLTETKGQVERIEQIFAELGKKPVAKECPVMLGLVEEATELMDEVKPSAVLDAGLAAHARAIEHYEIARYTALHEWAEALGMKKAAALLAKTLDQEEDTAETLTELAKTSLTPAATAGAKSGEKSALAAKSADGKAQMTADRAK